MADDGSDGVPSFRFLFNRDVSLEIDVVFCGDRPSPEVESGPPLPSL